MPSPDIRLLIADSEHDANQLYAAGIAIPDPFIVLQIQGRGTDSLRFGHLDFGQFMCNQLKRLALHKYPTNSAPVLTIQDLIKRCLHWRRYPPDMIKSLTLSTFHNCFQTRWDGGVAGTQKCLQD